MPDLFLGIDIGSGSTKGVLATAAGEIVGTAVREHAMSLPRPGWAEFDPETDWWEEVASISSELVAAAGPDPRASSTPSPSARPASGSSRKGSAPRRTSA